MCTTFTYVQCAYLRLEWTMALVQGHIEIASLESAVWTIQTRRINIHKTHKQNQFSDEFFARLRRAPFPFPQSSHWVEWTLLHCLRYGWNCTRMKRELIQLDYNEKKNIYKWQKKWRFSAKYGCFGAFDSKRPDLYQFWPNFSIQPLFAWSRVWNSVITIDRSSE